MVVSRRTVSQCAGSIALIVLATLIRQSLNPFHGARYACISYVLAASLLVTIVVLTVYRSPTWSLA